MRGEVRVFSSALTHRGRAVRGPPGAVEVTPGRHRLPPPPPPCGPTLPLRPPARPLGEHQPSPSLRGRGAGGGGGAGGCRSCKEVWEWWPGWRGQRTDPQWWWRCVALAWPPWPGACRRRWSTPRWGSSPPPGASSARWRRRRGPSAWPAPGQRSPSCCWLSTEGCRQHRQCTGHWTREMLVFSSKYFPCWMFTMMRDEERRAAAERDESNH